MFFSVIFQRLRGRKADSVEKTSVPEVPDDPWVTVAIVDHTTREPTGRQLTMRESLFNRIQTLVREEAAKERK